MAPPIFTLTSQSTEAGHTIKINKDGIAFSYCHNTKSCSNELGELGRTNDPYKLLPITLVDALKQNIKVSQAYTGGFPSSGHSALIDNQGYLYLCGCDRWQQLGLGSANAGASGYTWKGGRLWQTQFQRADHVIELLQQLDPNIGTKQPNIKSDSSSRRWIRDVALGGDHTVILSSNKKDVITFGKGGEGQLGLTSKPWVSSPSKSKVLSSSNPDIAAVCAFRHCSMTLDDSGQMKSSVGKCAKMRKALELCQKRAVESGLIDSNIL
jgi:alpha-tubulin suppressor-like RCC1 family protein